ncbi:hypothetical protein CR513_17543, partial [Mucuna pruriens]
MTWAKPVSKLLFGFTLTYMEEPKKNMTAENVISPTGIPKPTTQPALTWMSMIVPNAITRNRPRQESERKAPKMGKKLDKAFHRNIIIAPVAGSK